MSIINSCVVAEFVSAVLEDLGTGRNVLLVSIINSRVVAHQFAIGIDQFDATRSLCTQHHPNTIVIQTCLRMMDTCWLY